VVGEWWWWWGDPQGGGGQALGEAVGEEDERPGAPQLRRRRLDRCRPQPPADLVRPDGRGIWWTPLLGTWPLAHWDQGGDWKS